MDHHLRHHDPRTVVLGRANRRDFAPSCPDHGHSRLCHCYRRHSFSFAPSVSFQIHAIQQCACNLLASCRRDSECRSTYWEGYDSIVKQKDEIGKNVNGWLVGSALGDRAFSTVTGCFVPPERWQESTATVLRRPCTRWRKTIPQVILSMAAGTTIR